MIASPQKKKIRVAILHDWVLTWRGGEKCLQVISELFDNVEIYTLFCDPVLLQKYLPERKVVTGLLSRIPWVKYFYRIFLLFYPIDTWILSRRLRRRHEESPYDFVLSISHCAVKNVRVPDDLKHVCYCLTPMRYIWDQYERYLSHKWYEFFFRLPRKILQIWDKRGAAGVNYFIAISDFIRRRIEDVYQRDSIIVYPPSGLGRAESNIKSETLSDNKGLSSEPYFLVVNALVPYKNTKLIVEAFRALPYKLKVVGVGPEEKEIRSSAPPNVEFCGRVSDEMLSELYLGCNALIFAAEEDFGIAPVEAQSFGKPVICYGTGGCLETVVLDGKARTGLAFYELSAGVISDTVKSFMKITETSPEAFSEDSCKKNALKFTQDRFIENFLVALKDCVPDIFFEN
ncbi:MAG TPA: glycosyltransferase [Oligoflexia bacterium]|nr:glycosyltransferase [Oligoflexia bacterium]HMP47098.1 glycosyltransferase [Oligoflexia bacterium]